MLAGCARRAHASIGRYCRRERLRRARALVCACAQAASMHPTSPALAVEHLALSAPDTRVTSVGRSRAAATALARALSGSYIDGTVLLRLALFAFVASLLVGPAP